MAVAVEEDLCHLAGAVDFPWVIGREPFRAPTHLECGIEELMDAMEQGSSPWDFLVVATGFPLTNLGSTPSPLNVVCMPPIPIPYTLNGQTGKEYCLGEHWLVDPIWKELLLSLLGSQQPCQPIQINAMSLLEKAAQLSKN